MRFIGNIEAKVDAKGRLFIPVQFRKQLQTSSEEILIMRKDVFENCLKLYPQGVWDEEIKLLQNKLKKFNKQHEQIFRQFVSDVEIITPDSNGRILIPKRYLMLAKIKNDVRFIGLDNKIEIWAKEKIEESFMDAENFGSALEEIMHVENPFLS